MNSTLIITLKILIGLVALMLLVQGFLWSFMPESSMKSAEISSSSPIGMNYLKSNSGVAFFSMGLFFAMFVLQGNSWFLPSVIMLSGYILIRTVDLITAGYNQSIALYILIEIVIMAALFALKSLQSATAE